MANIQSIFYNQKDAFRTGQSQSLAGKYNARLSSLAAERPRGIGTYSCERKNRDDSQICFKRVLSRTATLNHAFTTILFMLHSAREGNRQKDLYLTSAACDDRSQRQFLQCNRRAK